MIDSYCGHPSCRACRHVVRCPLVPMKRRSIGVLSAELSADLSDDSCSSRSATCRWRTCEARFASRARRSGKRPTTRRAARKNWCNRNEPHDRRAGTPTERPRAATACPRRHARRRAAKRSSKRQWPGERHGRLRCGPAASDVGRTRRAHQAHSASKMAVIRAVRGRLVRAR